MASKNPERQFIHDVASPLGVIMGNLQILQMQMGKGDIPKEEILEKIEKCVVSCRKASEMLQARRQVLIEQGEENPS